MRVRCALAILTGLVAGPAGAEAPASTLAPPPWPQNFSSNVQGSGVPGIDGGHAFLWNQPAGFDPASTLRVDRHVPEGSGEPGHTYKALWAQTD